MVRKDYPGASKAFGIAGGVVGLALSPVAGASYLIAARPAWDSFTLPLMYLGAGLALGFLLMAALVLRRGDAAEDKAPAGDGRSDTLRGEGTFALKLALAGVAIMAVTVVAYVVWIAVAPHQASSRSVTRLLSGDLAVLFWACVVVVGMVAPVALVALAYSKGSKVSAAASPAGVRGFADAETAAESLDDAEASVVESASNARANAKMLSSYLLAAFVCTAVGAVAIRVIMYAIGTSVEQFIYQ